MTADELASVTLEHLRAIRAMPSPTTYDLLQISSAPEIWKASNRTRESNLIEATRIRAMPDQARK